jgi:cell division protein FtsQ
VYKYKPRKRRRALKGYVVPDEASERLRRRVRWRRVIAVAGLLAAVALAVVVYSSPLLRVREVEVVGANNSTPERVVEVADLEGESMFSVPLAAAQERILEMPLVRAVDARARWPNKVQIEVIERTPWGYWNLNDTSYVVDLEGYILSEVKPPEQSPVIYDLGDPAPLGPGDYVDADAVLLAQGLQKQVPEKLGQKITKFEYTPDDGLAITTDAGYRVVVGDSQNFDYKLTVWKAVEDEVGRAEMAGHVLDLRFRDRPSYQ